jgi:hypothetical protein
VRRLVLSYAPCLLSCGPHAPGESVGEASILGVSIDIPMSERSSMIGGPSWFGLSQYRWGISFVISTTTEPLGLGSRLVKD